MSLAELIPAMQKAIWGISEDASNAKLYTKVGQFTLPITGCEARELPDGSIEITLSTKIPI